MVAFVNFFFSFSLMVFVLCLVTGEDEKVQGEVLRQVADMAHMNKMGEAFKNPRGWWKDSYSYA
jgi:hypothetical protein